MRTAPQIRILLMLLPVMVHGQSAKQGEEDLAWTIAGGVTVDSGTPSEVRIRSERPERPADVSTDASGHYLLKGHKPGYYLISASKDGTASPPPKAVRMSAGERLDAIDFHLGKEAVISGRVLDPAKNPVPGVIVAACVPIYRNGRLRLQQKSYASTDDMGEYRILDLNRGRYVLTVTPATLKPRKWTSARREATGDGKRVTVFVRTAFYPGVELYESAAPIVLNDGEQREGADVILPLADSFCVRAAAIGPAGEPSVVLSLLHPVGDSFPTIASGTLRAGEKSEICGISPGRYRIQTYTFDPETKKATSFMLTDVIVTKRDVDVGNLYPQPGAALPGRIKIIDGNSASAFPGDLTVRLDQRGRPIIYGENRAASVRSDGSFLLEKVFPDEYGLSVSGLPNGYYVREATQNGFDAMRGVVRLDRGELVISLASDGISIRGKTVDTEDHPVPDATVILVSKQTSENATTITIQSDQSGAFEIDSGLGPGEYRIIAFTGLFEGEATDPAFVANHLPEAETIDAQPKASQTISLKARTAR